MALSSTCHYCLSVFKETIVKINIKLWYRMRGWLGICRNKKIKKIMNFFTVGFIRTINFHIFVKIRCTRLCHVAQPIIFNKKKITVGNSTVQMRRLLEG